MNKTIFAGSATALVTPLNEKGVNFDELEKLVEFQIANGTDALVICGTTGEASTMPDEEHLAAIEYTVKRVGGRVPVIAGTGSNETLHSIELSKEAERLGVDGLLQVTPYYNKTTQKGLVAHFSAIANAVKIPVILYNVPSRTGLNISVAALKELAKIDNIVAIKEASGNISYTAQVAAEVPELYIYSGNDDMIVPVMSLGGKGVISVLANVMPKETHDMCQAYFDGDCAKATKMQLEYLELVNNLFIEVNPIPVKTALNLMGKNAGDLRLPLIEMSEDNLAKLKASMQKHNLI